MTPYNLNINRSAQNDGAQRQQTSSKKSCDTQSYSLYLCQTPKYKHENYFQFPPRIRIRLTRQKRTTDKNLHLLPPCGSSSDNSEKENLRKRLIKTALPLALPRPSLFSVSYHGGRMCWTTLRGGNRQTSEEESVPSTRVSAAPTLPRLQYVPPHPAALLMKMLRIGQQPPSSDKRQPIKFNFGSGPSRVP